MSPEVTMPFLSQEKKIERDPLREAQRVANEQYISRADRELGEGDFATVLTREEDSFCVKVFKPGMLAGKSKEEIMREFAIQEKLYAGGVRVPKLIGHHYFEKENEYIIYMQKIIGFSLNRYIDGQIDLLENFDVDAFWADAETELEKAHSLGISHKDLHEGNLMIDDETGKAVIIDFGRSAEIDPTDSEAIKIDKEELEKTKQKFMAWHTQAMVKAVDN